MLTGLSKEQNIYFFYGPGSNGKSILLEIIRLVIGNEYVINADSKTLVHNGRVIREDISRLEGVRLATVAEIGKCDYLDEALVKGLTGGDRITSRELYKKSMEFRNVAKIIIVTNFLPEIVGTDYGIQRRIKVVPFTKIFTNEEMDKELMSKLTLEREGILALLVQNAVNYFKIGEILAPTEVENATSEYLESSNFIKCFLSECCCESNDGNTGDTLRIIYDNYQNFCHLNTYNSLPMREFSTLLKILGYKQKKSGSIRYWSNLSICSNRVNGSNTSSFILESNTVSTSNVESTLAEDDDQIGDVKNDDGLKEVNNKDCSAVIFEPIETESGIPG